MRDGADVVHRPGERCAHRVEAEMRRVQEWLEHDRPRLLENQMRLAIDQVHEAQQALHRCLMFPIANERPSCYEERAALKKAQARLAYCQRKAGARAALAADAAARAVRVRRPDFAARAAGRDRGAAGDRRAEQDSAASGRVSGRCEPTADPTTTSYDDVAMEERWPEDAIERGDDPRQSKREEGERSLQRTASR